MKYSIEQKVKLHKQRKRRKKIELKSKVKLYYLSDIELKINYQLRSRLGEMLDNMKDYGSYNGIAVTMENRKKGS